MYTDIAIISLLLAHCRNVVGGHIVSAIAGVGTRQLLADVICGRSGVDCTWLASALAVAIAIIFMLITQCVHPPGRLLAFV
jgi:CBS domain-containing membrane protein